MNTHPTVIKNLRSYQRKCFRHLFRHLQNGKREVILSGPTGCGKSLMVTYLIERLLRTDKFRSATIIAPQTQIQEGFLLKDAQGLGQDFLIEFGDMTPGQMSVLGDVLVNHKCWVSSTGKRADQFYKHVRAGDPSIKVLVTTHQAVSMWFGRDVTILPADLTGCILVIDEAHHASSDNQVGAFAKAWKAAGGTIIHLTATPFRNDGDILMDESAPRWTLTLADHIENGFAPRTVKIRSHPIPMTAQTLKELAGTVMGQVQNLLASVKVIDDLLKADGDPKAVILVPAIGAEAWATLMEEVLTTRGLRVFNAVLGGQARSEELGVVLRAERKAASKDGHYTESKYDVFLACARFNEGTDWPFCSHVYNIGLTNSFLLILQRLGRGLRPKSEIPGYPELNKDKTIFTFLVPTVSDEVFTAFEQKHQDHAFLTACFMADVDTGQGYLSDITRKLFDSRPRSGPHRPSEETWEDVIQFLNADVQTCRKAAGRMVRAINALQHEGVPEPSNGQVMAFLADRMGLTGEDLNQAGRALTYNRMRGEDGKKGKKALAFMNFRARLLGKLNKRPDYQGDPRIIREDLQPIFDEVLREFASEVADITLTASVVGYMSQFTGKTAKDVAHSMRRGLGKPQPTEAAIEDALRAYFTEWRKSPDITADASLYFGYAPNTLTWQDVNNTLSRRREALK